MSEPVAIDPVTGIYCRPDCARGVDAVPLSRQELRTRASTLLAVQVAGMTPCGRCQPQQDTQDRSPLSQEVLRAIAEGRVDDRGLAALAFELGVSSRHLHRVVVGATGNSPQQLAAARRTQTARALLAYTDLPVTVVGEAAGFSSQRQHSAVVTARTGMPPGRLRRWLQSEGISGTYGRSGRVTRLRVRLAYDPPMHWWPGKNALLQPGGSALSAAPGSEGAQPALATTMSLPNGSALAIVRPASGPWARADISLDDPRDLGQSIANLRRWLGLDLRASDHLVAHDPICRQVVAVRPGLRPPGAVDPPSVVVPALLLDSVPEIVARRTAALLLSPVPHDGLRGAAVPPTPAVILGRIIENGRNLDSCTTHLLKQAVEALASGAAPGEALSFDGVGGGARAYARLRLDADLTALPPPTSGVAKATGLGIPGAHELATRVPQARGLMWSHLWAAAAEARHSGRDVGSRFTATQTGPHHHFVGQQRLGGRVGVG